METRTLVTSDDTTALIGEIDEARGQAEAKSFNLVKSLFDGWRNNELNCSWRYLRNALSECPKFDGCRDTKEFKDGMFTVNQIIDLLQTELYKKEFYKSKEDQNYSNIADMVTDYLEYDQNIQNLEYLKFALIQISDEAKHWFERQEWYDKLLFDMRIMLHTVKWLQRQARKFDEAEKEYTEQTVAA